jgi:hypothetical protein
LIVLNEHPNDPHELPVPPRIGVQTLLAVELAISDNKPQA